MYIKREKKSCSKTASQRILLQEPEHKLTLEQKENGGNSYVLRGRWQASVPYYRAGQRAADIFRLISNHVPGFSLIGTDAFLLGLLLDLLFSIISCPMVVFSLCLVLGRKFCHMKSGHRRSSAVKRVWSPLFGSVGWLIVSTPTIGFVCFTLDCSPILLGSIGWLFGSDFS